jgi:hypothetical protein
MDTDMTKKFPYTDCGVNEEMFPCLGKCCGKNDTFFMSFYEKACSCCDISASLPCGPDLKITTIFECGLHSYGRRITE